MKKQDERILDMVGRVEVIQSRALQPTLFPVPMNPIDRTRGTKDSSFDVTEQNKKEMSSSGDITEAEHETSHIMSQPGDLTASSAGILADRLKQQDDHILDLIERMKSLESHLPRSALGSHAESDQARSALESPITRPQVRESAEKVSERTLLEMLREKSRTSVEIKERFGITREHAARVLKELFDRGIVVRNDSHKPFVYELTELGRQASGNA